MSEVKVTNLSHPSSGSANITLAADGSVVLPAGFTGGIGSNVVQTVKTDTFSTTSTSFTPVTGLSVTITPTSATSKILLLANVNMSGDISNDALALRFSGGNADDYIADTAGSRTSMATGMRATSVIDVARTTLEFSMMYLDSPATTSPVTYNVDAAIPTAGTVYVNRSDLDSDDSSHPRTASSITAIEVAA